MKRCEQVEKLLLAGEPLGVDDQRHLDDCGVCQKTALLVNRLSEAGAELALTDEVEPNVVAAVRQAVMEKVEPRPYRRWAMAISALTLGIMGVAVLLMTVGRQPQAVVDSGEDFLAFMDGLAIEQLDFQEDVDMGILDSDLFGTAEIAGDEDDDWAVPLSDSYLALEDVLEI